ncbi:MULTISPECIES: sporulation protein [Polymorphospora]|uniref:Sporulation protein n=1 Tax=Polymorphospora lycopeni TaxID=3140240 RepID=A0ABV5CYV5_9ACTN
MTNAMGVAVLDLVKRAVGETTAGTVFGEPVTRGDVTVIPVARVKGHGGGGGGGGNADPAAAGQAKQGNGSGGGPAAHAGGGSGAGMRLSARPIGVFVLRDGRVRWHPALDLNKVILGGQIVMVVALLTVRAVVRARHS